MDIYERFTIPESCVDESLSSTSSEDVPSHVDMNGVITWPKPVGEARPLEEIFFSPQCSGFFSSRPHFMDCTDKDRGRMNFIY